MEQWTDQGIVLSVRAHGENGAIVSLLTENHGRHAGYVQGAKSSKLRGFLQQGCLVNAHWKSRVADNLGSFTLEEDRNIPSAYMNDTLRLSAILSACSLCDSSIAEREGHAGLFHGLMAFFDALDTEQWTAIYVMWEIALLKELGFGLNLGICAGGGDIDTLCYVSPKSGQAVSVEKGEPYKDRLLVLPEFLRPSGGSGDDEQVLEGLRMTAYFLEHWVYTHHTKGVPQERLRFEARFAKNMGQSTLSNDSHALSSDLTDDLVSMF